MPTEIEKRYAIIAGLRAGRSVKQICEFFGYPRDYVYRIKKKFHKADDKESFTGELHRRAS